MGQRSTEGKKYLTGWRLTKGEKISEGVKIKWRGEDIWKIETNGGR